MRSRGRMTILRHDATVPRALRKRLRRIVRGKPPVGASRCVPSRAASAQRRDARGMQRLLEPVVGLPQAQSHSADTHSTLLVFARRPDACRPQVLKALS
jgi:hypothetical protein